MHFSIPAIAAVAVLFPALALAQAQYNASDIVEHFNAPVSSVDVKDASCPPGTPCISKKKTRAVCIGTDSACAAEEEVAKAAQPVGGFDLLITFELGSDRLSDQAMSNLREFAKALSSPALEGAVFNVDGHTDASGSDSFNEQLSARRAKAVVAYLTELGVPQERLEAKGYGESKPRSDDPFAAINRRVEATIRTQ